jgi:endonuclease/exonuclease/phosphatase family metal-dependent hydrolase
VPLRVMTWNLWWRFGPWEQRERAIVEVIRAVDPDVVCLQEVWSAEGGEDQVTRLAGALGLHGVSTDPVFYGGMSFGNAVLARWPVERIVDEPLPRLDGRPGHRRVLGTVLATPFGSWPVYATHLDHRFDASSAREVQARRLLEVIAAHRTDPETELPAVIGADLNAVPDSDEVRALTGRRDSGVGGIVLTDCWEQVGDDGGATWVRDNPYTTDTAWPGRRIDYVLVAWPRPKPVGNPIRAWLAATDDVLVEGEPIRPSDHAAVVVELVTP